MPRSIFVRRAVFGLVAALCVLSWIALAAVYLTDQPRQTLIVAAVVAALATELTVWTGAILLGWKAFENRAAIWRRLTGRGAA